ncbi:MAG: acetolactate decarboxylase [Myxococcales bacterium]|nr:acetolactate decarboxylase [Myxococcales bacterium]MDD9965261.1 acetolactate decarboxylase [Myxococcales bacterium]
MKKIVAMGFLGAALWSCFDSNESESPDQATEPVERVDVELYGQIREILMEGRTEPRVELADLSLSPTTYGLGALSELRGEITIIDGQTWLAYSEPDGSVRIEQTTKPQDRAALLAMGRVCGWREMPINAEVAQPALGERVSALARESGFEGDGPLVFLVNGPVKGLHWHVVDGSRVPAGQRGREAIVGNSVQGVLDEGQVALVGFYAPDAQGIFVPPQSSVHVHVVSDEGMISGHVDEVVVLPGATLRLPVGQCAQ